MLHQNISQNQQQLLSVDQRQSLQILAFNNQELDAFLTEEYMQNPLLECDRDRQSEIIDSLDGHYEYASSYKDHYIKYEDEDSDRRGDIRAAEQPSLRSQLKGQLNIREYTAQELEIIDYLINCLDEKGFFFYSPEEIASVLNCSSSTVSKCLNDLKQLEPAGIFSADISECLLKQLQARNEKDEVLIRIVSEYLPDLLHGNLSGITRSLGITTSKCRACVQKIGELNPRPIMNTETGNTGFIVPDILISRDGGDWTVTLNDGWMGEYRFNDYYIQMMQTAADPELKEYFRGKLERARLIVNSIDRRRGVLPACILRRDRGGALCRCVLRRDRHGLKSRDCGRRARDLFVFHGDVLPGVEAARTAERHRVSLCFAVSLGRDHAQAHEFTGGAVLELNEPAALPIAE